MTEQHASLKPSTFTQGGLIDDVDVDFTEARFVEWDYGGTIDVMALAFCLKMADDEGTEHIQYYSAGDIKNWEPSEDGHCLVRVGSATTINDSSNFSQLVASLVNSGFPEDKIDDDATIFEGMRCHVRRVAQPKRTGLINKQDGERERTVLLVTEIHKLPWEKKGKGKAAAKGKGKTRVAAKDVETVAAEDTGDDGDINDKATETVMGILADNGGGPVTKANLSKAIFKVLEKDSDRNKIVQIAYKEEFLTEGPWEYDGAQVSLG